MKSWTPKQIKQHETAAHRLGLIKDEFYSYILENVGMSKAITEKGCIGFIKKSYKKHKLVNDHKKEFAIVAFGKNTKEIHYFPKGKGLKLTPNTLILLDMWARLDTKNSSYADTTFMFYFKPKNKGKNSKFKEYKKIWKVLVKSRDNAINYIKREIEKSAIPRGLDIDRVAHDIIGEAGLWRGIKHTVGHSLGFDSPHGKLPGINWREYSPILHNVGYTIEPGIYLEEFGMRTEIDIYINSDKVIITTPLQKNLEIINA